VGLPNNASHRPALRISGARETERNAIEKATRDSIQTTLSELRSFAVKRPEGIRKVLHKQVQAARFELSKEVDRIVMRL